MATLSPSVLVLVAVLATALAQVLLKQASYFEMKSSPWVAYMGLSAVAYGLSFVLYSRILKYYALNKIYPAMTISQIMLVTLYGLVIGEAIDSRHALGLLCGVLAIYLILT
jgi:uncharacterized membrane protein